MKGKKEAPSSSEKEEEDDDDNDDENDQRSTSSFMDEETVRCFRKVMGMIHTINLMDVPLQVEDLLFNIDRKKKIKRGCFACGEKDHFRDNCPNMAKPTKRRSNGKALTNVKTWDDSSSEDDPPGLAATILYYALHGHLTNALRQEVKQVSHPLVMISMMSVMMREIPL
jgi:hypothetical protein